jgi:hypothetical protein
MVAKPFENCNNFLKKVRTLKRAVKYMQKKDHKFSQYIADNWLAYRYGILPNIRLAHDLMAAPFKEVQERFTSRSSGFSDFSSETVDATDPGNYDVSKHCVKNHSVVVSGGCLYQWEQTFNSAFGLRISDIPSAIWELLPYSFVVDWVLNVGDYVQAITPKKGVNHLASWATVRETITVDCYHSAVWTYSGSDYESVSTPSGVIHYTRQRIERIPGPQAGISWSKGAFSGISGLDRLVDAVSLLRQTLTK